MKLRTTKGSKAYSLIGIFFAALLLLGLQGVSHAATDGTSVTVASVRGIAGQSVTLSAVLRRTNDNVLLTNCCLSFYVNNAYVGTTATDSTGTARVTYRYMVPGTTGVALPIKVVRLANHYYDCSAGSGTLIITRFQEAQCSGGFMMDNLSSACLYVSALKNFSLPAAPTTSGSIFGAGRTGTFAASFSASIASITFDYTSAGYPHATITCNPSWCLNMNTGTRAYVVIVVELTQSSPQATVKMTTTDYSTGQTVPFASTPGLPLGSGHIAILE